MTYRSRDTRPRLIEAATRFRASAIATHRESTAPPVVTQRRGASPGSKRFSSRIVARSRFASFERAGSSASPVRSNDVDASAPNVRAADEAVLLGRPHRPTAISAETIIEAAAGPGPTRSIPAMVSSLSAMVRSGHPRAGLTFVGPPPEAMRRWEQDAARTLAVAAGVRSFRTTEAPRDAIRGRRSPRSSAIQVLLRRLLAVVGREGGWFKTRELSAALDAARREAKNAFGEERCMSRSTSGPAPRRDPDTRDAHGNVLASASANARCSGAPE